MIISKFINISTTALYPISLNRITSSTESSNSHFPRAFREFSTSCWTSSFSAMILFLIGFELTLSTTSRGNSDVFVVLLSLSGWPSKKAVFKKLSEFSSTEKEFIYITIHSEYLQLLTGKQKVPLLNIIRIS